MLRYATPFAIAAVALLAACTDTGPGQQGMVVAPTPTAPPVTPLTSSQQVLRIASESSETAEPVTINNGAFVFTDTAETSAPLAINP